MLSEMSENSQGGSAKKQMRVKFRQIALQDLEIDQGDKVRGTQQSLFYCCYVVINICVHLSIP